MTKFIVEARDAGGWYDHSDHATEAEAIAEVNSWFDPAMIRDGNVRIVDTDAMDYVKEIAARLGIGK